VLAAMNANIWDQGDDIKALIRSGASIDPDRLAAPSVALADLLSGSSATADRLSRG
jgi:3-phenylpropionate/trans-cinnamate dioxygenase ferredoxin reductase component